MPLPPGLFLNRSTGAVSGTPSQAGTFEFTLRVRDAQGQFRDIPNSLTILAYTAPTLSGAYPLYATRTVSYSGSLSVADGTAPFTWSVASGTLPTGLSLNTGTGAITGTPTDTTYTARPLTIRCVDANGSIVQHSFTLAYANVLSYPSTYPAGFLSGAYDHTPATTGGHLPRVFSYTGTLPPGLTYDPASGRLFGTPSSVGTYPVTLTCTDAAGRTSVITPTLTMNAAYVNVDVTGAATGTTANIEEASGPATFSPDYSGVVVSGGSGGYSYSWVRISGSASLAAAAPSSLNTGFTGTIAPGGSASATFRLTATDGTSSDTLDVSVTMNNVYVAPSLSGSPSLFAMRTKPYSSGFTRSGGKAPFTFAITSGTLPTGLSINSSTGLISGTPTLASYSSIALTVRVTDSEGTQDSESFTLQYVDVLALTGTPGNASQNQPYSYTPARSGGFATFVYSIASGTLPTGLSLNTSTGAVTGTPTVTTAGANVTIRVTDGQGYTADNPVTFVVLAYANVDLSGSVSGQSSTVTTYAGTKTFTPDYSLLATTGGSGTITYSWVRQSGSAAISADSPAIKGTAFSATAPPNSTVSAVFRVTATDGISSDTFDVTVSLQNLYIEPTLSGTLTARATRTVAYSNGLTVNNGLAAFTWAITSGTLPTGMTINASTGVISGTPTDTSYTTRNITVQVTDGQGRTASSAQTIAYRNMPNMVAATIARGWRTVAYSASAAVSNPSETHTLTYTVNSGTLPTGITLNSSTGALTGTPTSTSYGNIAVVIRATDTDGNFDQDTITIPYANVLSASESTPDVASGAAYTGSVSGSGGFTPYGYAVQTGTLPAGITLNTSTGAISGSSTVLGAHSGTFRVTDAGAATADVAWSFTVAAALAITPTIVDTTENASYTGGASASGGTAPYTYSVFSGSLPTGLSLNSSTGAITGTATTPGTFTFVLRVTDNVAATANTASQQIVVANTVNLVDRSVNRATSTATTAGWKIDNDGVVYTLLGASYTAQETWRLSGASSDYEVRATLASGTSPGGSAVGSWLACSTDREWTQQDVVNDGIAIECTLTIEMRRAGGTGAILKTATISISSERV